MCAFVCVCVFIIIQIVVYRTIYYVVPNPSSSSSSSFSSRQFRYIPGTLPMKSSSSPSSLISEEEKKKKDGKRGVAMMGADKGRNEQRSGGGVVAPRGDPFLTDAVGAHHSAASIMKNRMTGRHSGSFPPSSSSPSSSSSSSPSSAHILIVTNPPGIRCRQRNVSNDAVGGKAGEKEHKDTQGNNCVAYLLISSQKMNVGSFSYTITFTNVNNPVFDVHDILITGHSSHYALSFSRLQTTFPPHTPPLMPSAPPVSIKDMAAAERAGKMVTGESPSAAVRAVEEHRRNAADGGAKGALSSSSLSLL
mmetsp:Transcript_32243/g.54668  ORF Transcript_32243/g.54668 Transcript_32243/m.54668 type:complete len:306 (-) Transcript_32243:8-925(-)